jgi:hypothetical protein
VLSSTSRFRCCDSSEKDITTFELTDSYNGEVRRGDRVMLEQDAMLPTLFYPTRTNQVKDGGKSFV